MNQNNTKYVASINHTLDLIIIMLLFFFFINVNSPNKSIEQTFIKSTRIVGGLIIFFSLLYIIDLIKYTAQHKYAKIKRLVFRLAPVISTRRIATIFVFIFPILMTILYKKTIHDNFILSIRLSGWVWGILIISDQIIDICRKKRYEEIMKQRRKEPQEVEKQVESTI